MSKVYGIHTGNMTPDCLVGMLVDETGHAMAQHISSDLGWMEHDLKRHAREQAPDAEYVFVGDHRESAPRPCKGCDDCASGERGDQ